MNCVLISRKLVKVSFKYLLVAIRGSGLASRTCVALVVLWTVDFPSFGSF